MAGRSTASATISFGLVSVPVKFYLAAASETFSFNMISPDGNRVEQKLFDKMTGKEISRSDCRKGYEYSKDQFVIFTDDEVDCFAGEKANAIDLLEFVDDTNFNPIQVEKTYYLGPDKGAERTYRLLAVAMASLNKIAVGKYYARGKDYLVCLKPVDGRLVLFQMYYANEVRAFDTEFSNNSAPTDEEINLAKELIGKHSNNTFDARKYNDEFAERVRNAIDTKVKGKELQSVSDIQKIAPIIDLAALLMASINEGKKVPSDITKPSKTIEKEKTIAPVRKQAAKKKD